MKNRKTIRFILLFMVTGSLWTLAPVFNGASNLSAARYNRSRLNSLMRRYRAARRRVRASRRGIRDTVIVITIFSCIAGCGIAFAVGKKRKMKSGLKPLLSDQMRPERIWGYVDIGIAWLLLTIVLARIGMGSALTENLILLMLFAGGAVGLLEKRNWGRVLIMSTALTYTFSLVGILLFYSSRGYLKYIMRFEYIGWVIALLVGFGLFFWIQAFFLSRRAFPDVRAVAVEEPEVMPEGVGALAERLKRLLQS